VNRWLEELEYSNSIFFTWKGEANTQHTALEYAVDSAKLSKEVLGYMKDFNIKLLTKRGDV